MGSAHLLLYLYNISTKIRQILRTTKKNSLSKIKLQRIVRTASCSGSAVCCRSNLRSSVRKESAKALDDDPFQLLSEYTRCQSINVEVDAIGNIKYH